MSWFRWLGLLTRPGKAWLDITGIAGFALARLGGALITLYGSSFGLAWFVMLWHGAAWLGVTGIMGSTGVIWFGLAWLDWLGLSWPGLAWLGLVWLRLALALWVLCVL